MPRKGEQHARHGQPCAWTEAVLGTYLEPQAAKRAAELACAFNCAK